MMQMRAFVNNCGVRSGTSALARWTSGGAMGAPVGVWHAVPPLHRPAKAQQVPGRRTLHVSAMTYAEPGAAPPIVRTFTQFSIYKGKAAVTFKVIPPTFRQVGSGSYVNYNVDREGVLFLEFAAVQQAQGFAPGTATARSYDWANKATFALKPLELAQLTDLDNLPDVSKGIEIFHDPNKGSNDPGVIKVAKRLKLAYNPQGEGYFLTFNQSKEGAQSVNFSVPVSRSEFVVLKHLASYLIPRLIGFDMLFEGAGAVPTNLVQGAPSNSF